MARTQPPEAPIVCALLVLVSSMASWPHRLNAQDIPLRYAGARKLVVDDTGAAAARVISGHTPLAQFRYGDRTVFVVSDSAARAILPQRSSKLEAGDELDRIYLRGRVLTTSDTVPAPTGTLRRASLSRGGLFLIQFAAPVKEEWLRELRRLPGIRTISFIRSNAYLVWVPTGGLPEFQDFGRTRSFVQWIGRYHPAYAVAPGLTKLAAGDSTTARVLITVQLAQHPGIDQDIADIRELADSVLRPEWRFGPYTNLRIAVPSSRLPTIAAIASVVNVEEFVPPVPTDERQGQILANQLNAAGSQVNGVGYLAFLTGLGLGDAGGLRFRARTMNSVSAGQQRRPDVATAPDGSSVVVWQDDQDENGKYQILMRGFRADGSERFTQRTANTVAGGQQLYPAVAVAPDGRFVVVWQDDQNRNGIYQIHMRGFNADGSQRFGQQTVNAVSSGQQYLPSIAMGADGRFVVVWEDDQDENGFYQILMRGFNPNGSQRFGQRTVNTVSDGQQVRPRVSSAADGRFVVAWQDDQDENGFYQIRMRGFNSSGSQRFSQRTVNTVSSGQQRKPSIAVAPDGSFTVAWEDDQNQNGVYQIHMRGFLPSGSQQSAQQTVNATASGQQLNPRVTAAGDGTFAVAWEDDRNSNGVYQIYARAYRADGDPCGSDFTVNEVAAGQQLYPALAANSTAGMVAVWQDDQNRNGKYEIVGRGLSSVCGVTVDVTDSGFDRGRNEVAVHGDLLGRDANSRQAYVQRVDQGTIDFSPERNHDQVGHGTLDASIVAGFNDASDAAGGTTDVEDGAGYQFGLGIAPFVRVGSSKIFHPDVFTDPDFTTLISSAHRFGARISNNSWGQGRGDLSAYTTVSQEYDALVRDSRPTGAVGGEQDGNQETVIVFSAGNNGAAAGTLGNNGSTAKNTIVVGASENDNQAGADGCGVANAGANDARDIIDFSSRGPTDDGRIRPDVVAPGTHIYGAISQHTSYDGTGVCGPNPAGRFFPVGQTLYSWSSGTSHSAPAVAGSAALLRQWFANREWGVPSPAMTKAYLTNGATWLSGVNANDNLFSNNQGMGRVNLQMMFDDTPRILIDQTEILDQTGDAYAVTGSIANVARPFRVSLAWTDEPGPAFGAASVNDLDLQVTVDDGATQTVFLGNVFTLGASRAGGAADRANNLESVWLPAGTRGRFTVTVTGATIGGDGVPNIGDALDQDFALVIYNASPASTADDGGRFTLHPDELCRRVPALCGRFLDPRVCIRFPELCAPRPFPPRKGGFGIKFRDVADVIVIPLAEVCGKGGVVSCPEVGRPYALRLAGLPPGSGVELWRQDGRRAASDTTRAAERLLRIPAASGEDYLLVLRSRGRATNGREYLVRMR